MPSDTSTGGKEHYAGHEAGETPRCDNCGEPLDVEPIEDGSDVGWCDGCGLLWYLRPGGSDDG